MNPFERLTARLSLGLATALLPTPLLLAVPAPGTDHEGLLAASTAHLATSMGLALMLSLWVVWPTFRGWTNERLWFAGLREPARFFATAVVHVAAVGGVTLLVALAWAAALRLQPSLQYLQLISVLDVVWGVVALTAALGFLSRSLPTPVGRSATAGVVSLFVAYCQWPLWRYLANVGFTPDGGWKVDGGAMWRYILPFDMVAALFVLSVVGLALWRAAGTVRQQTTGHAGRQRTVVGPAGE